MQVHTVSESSGDDEPALLAFSEQKKLFKRKRSRGEQYAFCCEAIQRNIGGWRRLVNWVLCESAGELWDRLVIGEQLIRLNDKDGLYLLLRDPYNRIDMERFVSLQEDCKCKFPAGEVTLKNYTVATLASLNNSLAAQFVDAGLHMSRQVYLLCIDPYLLFLYRCRIESINWYETCLVTCAFLCAVIVLLIVFL